jgi:hypothetical protein
MGSGQPNNQFNRVGPEPAKQPIISINPWNKQTTIIFQCYQPTNQFIPLGPGSTKNQFLFVGLDQSTNQFIQWASEHASHPP